MSEPDAALLPLCSGCWALLPPGTPYVLVQVRHMERDYELPYCQECRHVIEDTPISCDYCDSTEHHADNCPDFYSVLREQVRLDEPREGAGR